MLGVGNVLQGDDGAGPHLISRLAATGTAPDVTLIDGGTVGLPLLETVENADSLIVVDAADTGLDPGAVSVYENEAFDRFLNRQAALSVHEAGLSEVLTAARLRRRLPARRALVGIQPAVLGWNTELSAAVQAGIEQALTRVAALLEDYRQ